MVNTCTCLETTCHGKYFPDSQPYIDFICVCSQLHWLSLDNSCVTFEPSREKAKNFGFGVRKPRILVLDQKIAKRLKFQNWKEASYIYHPVNENKSADQLCSYCEADLRLCFCICRALVFP